MSGQMHGTGRPVRVLRVIDRLNIGGPAQHVTWLSAGLATRGFETVLVTGTVARGEGDMSGFAAEHGVTPVVFPEMSRELSLNDVRVILKLFRLARRFKPDIIHTHKAKAGAVGRAAAWMYRWLTPSMLWLRPRRCHVVHTFHGHVFHGYYGAAKSRVFVAIERVLARLVTDTIVVVSPQQRDEIQGRFKVGTPAQVRVIRLGLAVASKACERGLEVRDSRDERVIGAVGRLCDVKNFGLLFEAFAKLACTDDRVKLVMVGDGELRQDLGAHAARLGLEHRIRFAGFQSNTEEWYRRFTVTALSSVNEGTPLSLIESMAAGTPVVATAVGGVPDLMGARVQDEAGFTMWEHGLTAPSRDADALAAALRWMLDHPDERAALASRAAQFVCTQYSVGRLLTDMEALYAGLLTDSGSPA
jgi:glycosyltransferase involved in cell wall biosynthesis